MEGLLILYRKIIYLNIVFIFVIVIVDLVFIGFFTSVSHPISSFDGFFCYGDSIIYPASFDSTHFLSLDPCDNWICQLRNMYFPNMSVDYNKNGASRGSIWGLEHFNDFYNSSSIFFECFGINDICHGIPVEVCADAKIRMFENSTGYGYFCCLPIIFSNRSNGYANFSVQKSYVDTLENILVDAGVPVIKLYDAVDTIPRNGIFDSWDPCFYYNGVHIDRQGHRAVADFVYDFLVDGGFC